MENAYEYSLYLQSPELTGQIQRSLPRLVHEAGVGLVLQQHLGLRAKETE